MKTIVKKQVSKESTEYVYDILAYINKCLFILKVQFFWRYRQSTNLFLEKKNLHFQAIWYILHFVYLFKKIKYKCFFSLKDFAKY